MKAFVATKTAVNLTADGMRVRLERPGDVFKAAAGCKAPAYVLPDEIGGFITLVEYGVTDCAPACSSPKSCGGCGCGGGCSTTVASGTDGAVISGQRNIVRYEELAYSGYDTDDQTLILTERAVDGLKDQEWPAGTLVFQSGVATYISQLEKIGCILGVKKAADCLSVAEGEWIADPVCACWRQAQRKLVITRNNDGTLSFPASDADGGDDWSACFGLGDLLTNALIKVPELEEQVSANTAYIEALKKLGCILAVKKAENCMAVAKGGWVADPTCECWRQAQCDTAIGTHEDGSLNFPAPGEAGGDAWSKCYTLEDLLTNALIKVPELEEQVSANTAYIEALKKLGCILAVKKAGDCTAVDAGDWVADPECQCWRMAKCAASLGIGADGSLNFPALDEGETDTWTKCYTLNELLTNALITVPELVEALKGKQDQLIDGTTGEPLAGGTTVATTQCGGGEEGCPTIPISGPVVACSQMGAGFTFDEDSKTWTVDAGINGVSGGDGNDGNDGVNGTNGADGQSFFDWFSDTVGDADGDGDVDADDVRAWLNDTYADSDCCDYSWEEVGNYSNTSLPVLPDGDYGFVLSGEEPANGGPFSETAYQSTPFCATAFDSASGLIRGTGSSNQLVPFSSSQGNINTVAIYRKVCN